MSNKKVLIIVGTRPEAIKLLPIYVELKKSQSLTPVLVSTGQHREMLKQVFQYWGLEPDIELNVMTKNQSLAGLTSLLFTKIDAICEEVSPWCVLVQGDTTSAMVGSLIGFYRRCKIGHVEAGLRTFDKYSPFPEEVNRQIIGVTADYHFCPTQKALEILAKEGKSNTILTGNSVIDSLNFVLSKVRSNMVKYEMKYQDILKKGPLVLVTGHRRESFGDGFNNICNAIGTLASDFSETQWVYPVHLNPKVNEPVRKMLEHVSNVKLIEPVPYDEMVYLMDVCHMILTDSGGIQEEGPTMNKPILVMRDNTERPEGVESGCAVLTGTSSEKIIDTFTKIYSDNDMYQKMADVSNPYGDGKTSLRIREYLENAIK